MSTQRTKPDWRCLLPKENLLLPPRKKYRKSKTLTEKAWKVSRDNYLQLLQNFLFFFVNVISYMCLLVYPHFFAFSLALPSTNKINKDLPSINFLSVVNNLTKKKKVNKRAWINKYAVSKVLIWYPPPRICRHNLGLLVTAAVPISAEPAQLKRN